jgi:hypothetical protein
MFFLMILYYFFLLPAQVCFIIVYIWKVESHVQKLWTDVHLKKFPMLWGTLILRHRSFKR